MDYLKLGYLVCIFWCQTQAVPITTHDCPNNFSYLFGDKCYSLNVDDEYSYADAVGFCKKHGGVLWTWTSNEEELEFLKKVHIKMRRIYWIGIRKLGFDWEYWSDNSSASETLHKMGYGSTSESTDRCYFIKTGGALATLQCEFEMYTLCEYTGKKCKVRKAENVDCYEFTDTPENFTGAANTCKLLGARIAEFRNECQLNRLRDALSRNKEFKDIDVENIKVSVGSYLPPIWNLKYPRENEDYCEVYASKKIYTRINCTEGLRFVCKFNANTWNGDNLCTNNIMFAIIPTTIVTTVIIIGIIVLVILQFKLLGKKEGKSKYETVYLEPMNSTSQPSAPVRWIPPIAPTGTVIKNSHYNEVNENEYESVHVPNTSFHQYTQID